MFVGKSEWVFTMKTSIFKKNKIFVTGTDFYPAILTSSQIMLLHANNDAVISSSYRRQIGIYRCGLELLWLIYDGSEVVFRL